MMMPHDSPKDLWVGASGYERFMGRWSRELARVFVSWLGIPPGRHWLEVGCGTGALTSRILEIGRPASVVATDSSEQFIAHVRTALPDHRVQFLTASADRLPTKAFGYDVVASSLVLNFLPDPTAALRAMRSLAAEDGVVAACLWDYAGGMQFLRRFWDAAVELDPSARQYDEGERFPICSPAALKAAFREAGFSRVGVEALAVATRFQDFDDYWTPFVGGPGPAPGYLSSLPAQRQQDLARRLAATLPRNEDGSIALTANAWAARAEKQSAA
jgi:ubiquinone/menaquinone biosynthesis C-methylase UbiE